VTISAIVASIFKFTGFREVFINSEIGTMILKVTLVTKSQIRYSEISPIKALFLKTSRVRKYI